MIKEADCKIPRGYEGKGQAGVFKIEIALTTRRFNDDDLGREDKIAPGETIR